MKYELSRDRQGLIKYHYTPNAFRHIHYDELTFLEGLVRYFLLAKDFAIKNGKIIARLMKKYAERK